jgi:hypothetical protein
MHEHFFQFYRVALIVSDVNSLTVKAASHAIVYGYKLMGHSVCMMAYVKQSVQYFQLLGSALVITGKIKSGTRNDPFISFSIKHSAMQ